MAKLTEQVARKKKPRYSEEEIRGWSKERLEAEMEDIKPKDWEYVLVWFALFTGVGSPFALFWGLDLWRREKEYKRLREIWKERL